MHACIRAPVRAPPQVEAALLVSRYVSSIMMYAEAVQSYAIALVVPEKSFLVQWADSKGIPSSDFEALCANPEAAKEVLKSINEVRESPPSLPSL